MFALRVDRQNLLVINMKIKLEYNNLTITIEADSLETICDAVITGGEVLQTLKKLGYGYPKVTWDQDVKDS